MTYPQTGVFPPYECTSSDAPTAEALSDEVLSLPMHPYLSAAQQDYIVARVRDALQKGDPPA